jgi:hypothetical protein
VATVAAGSCGRRWRQGGRRRPRRDCAEIIRAAEDGRRAAKVSSAVRVHTRTSRAVTRVRTGALGSRVLSGRRAWVGGRSVPCLFLFVRVLSSYDEVSYGAFVGGTPDSGIGPDMLLNIRNSPESWLMRSSDPCGARVDTLRSRPLTAYPGSSWTERG